MKKLIISCIVLSMLICTVAACNNQPASDMQNSKSDETSKIDISSQVQSSQSSEAAAIDTSSEAKSSKTEVISSADEVAQLTDALTVKAKRSEIKASDIPGGINGSPKLLNNISGILSKNDLMYVNDISGIDFKNAESTVKISLYNQESPRRGEIFHLEMYLLPPDAQMYAGKMLLLIFKMDKVNSVNLVYDKDIYQKIISLLKENTYSYKIKIDGEYKKINSSYDFKSHSSFEVNALELNDVMLCRIWDSQFEDISFYEAVNKNDGSCLYSFTAGTKNADSTIKDNVIKIEKAKYKDYDYRLFTSRSIIYRSSKDKNASYVYNLPDSISFDQAGKKRVYFDADLEKNRLAYYSTDGIYLSALDGSNAKLVFKNCDIPKLLEGKDLRGGDASKGYYDAPKITKSGVCAVVVIPNPDDNPIHLAEEKARMKELNPRMSIDEIVIKFPSDTPLLTIYNAENGKYINLSDIFPFNEFDKDYDFDLLKTDSNQNILAINDSDTLKIDAATFEQSKLSLGLMSFRTGNGGSSYDYINHIYNSIIDTDNHTLHSYCYETKADKQLIKISGTPNFGLKCVTENYALCSYMDSQDKGLILVKYK